MVHFETKRYKRHMAVQKQLSELDRSDVEAFFQAKDGLYLSYFDRIQSDPSRYSYDPVARTLFPLARAVAAGVEVRRLLMGLGLYALIIAAMVFIGFGMTDQFLQIIGIGVIGLFFCYFWGLPNTTSAMCQFERLLAAVEVVNSRNLTGTRRQAEIATHQSPSGNKTIAWIIGGCEVVVYCSACLVSIYLISL